MTKSEAGKLGAEKRWMGHGKTIYKDKLYLKEYQKKYRSENKDKINKRSYLDKYPNGATEKKIFSNMRYKARKVKAEGCHTFEEWMMVKLKYKNMCLCCKQFEPNIKLTEDHIIPLSMGGSDYINNIQPLCVSCNTRKHAVALTYLTYREFGDLTASPTKIDWSVN